MGTMILIIVFLGFSCSLNQGLDKQVRSSRFIFEGTVQKLDSSNLSVIVDPKYHAVVTVNRIIDAPSNFKSFLNRDVTVVLNETTKLEKGQKTVFFTNDWLYGESIALIESKRTALNDQPGIAEKIISSRQKQNELALKERLTKAELVVMGKITRISPVDQGLTPNLSEHDPEWKQAEIQIERVIKGNFTKPVISFIFPSSRDVMWVSYPKYNEGQDGIWLLYQDQLESLQIRPKPKGFTALYPEDYFPRSEMERIGRLLD